MFKCIHLYILKNIKYQSKKSALITQMMNHIVSDSLKQAVQNN